MKKLSLLLLFITTSIFTGQISLDQAIEQAKSMVTDQIEISMAQDVLDTIIEELTDIAAVDDNLMLDEAQATTIINTIISNAHHVQEIIPEQQHEESQPNTHTSGNLLANFWASGLKDGLLSALKPIVTIEISQQPTIHFGIYSRITDPFAEMSLPSVEELFKDQSNPSHDDQNSEHVAENSQESSAQTIQDAQNNFKTNADIQEETPPQETDSFINRYFLNYINFGSKPKNQSTMQDQTMYAHNDEEFERMLAQINENDYVYLPNYGTTIKLDDIIKQQMPLLIQLKARQQTDGTTCGYRSAAHIGAIDNLLHNHVPITAENIQCDADKFMEHMSDDELYNDDIMNLEAVKEKNNVLYVNQQSNTIVWYDHAGQTQTLEHEIELLKLLKNGAIHFIINTGGHWVSLSLVKQDDQEPVVLYINPTNAALVEAYNGYKLINELYDIILGLYNLD